MLEKSQSIVPYIYTSCFAARLLRPLERAQPFYLFKSKINFLFPAFLRSKFED